MKKSQAKFLVAFGLIIGLAIITALLGWDKWLNWLIFLSVATGILTDLYSAEGYWICYVFCIISYGVYIPFCIFTNYYGEIIVSILVIAVSIITLLRWKKHTKNKVVEIKKLSTKEMIIFLASCIIVFVSAGFVFMAIDTAYPFINSLAMVSTVASYYLAWRISRLQFIFGIFDSICLIILWILAGINDGWQYALFAVGGMVAIFYMIYGWFNWGKIYKKQIDGPPM